MNHFKAIFLVGGPGSGKDFLIHSTLNEFTLKEVSMERMFNAIVKETNIEELENFPSIIVNGNADNKDKIVVTKAILEEMGYDTAMIYVYTSDESSKSRNDSRIARGAKTFNESLRKIKYEKSVSNLSEYSNMFDSFLLFDNSNSFSNVNESTKQEITNWLLELSQIVSGFLIKEPTNDSAVDWIKERVMEIGTKSTADFIKALTPGQGSNHVNTYKEADSKTKSICRCKDKCECGDTNKGGVASADAKRTDRSGEGTEDYAAKGVYEEKNSKKEISKVKKQTKSLNYPSITNTAYGSIGPAVSGPAGGTGYSGQNEEKKKMPKVLPRIPPESAARTNGYGGSGSFDASSTGVCGVAEAKKSEKKYKPGRLSSAFGKIKDLGNPDACGGSPGSAPSYSNGTYSTFNEAKKKKFKKPEAVQPPNIGSAQNFGTGDSGSCLTNVVTEKKSFNQVRERISSTTNNVDKELEG